MGFVERRGAKILINSEAKRKLYVQPETMMVWIDLYRPKRELQMQDSKAGLAADPLSDDRRTGRIDAGNAHIKYTSRSAGSTSSAHISTDASTTAVGQLA